MSTPCFEDMTWKDYFGKMTWACAIMFSMGITFASLYIGIVGTLLGSFFYWAFTVNLWLPVSYHTWFILATIPMVNLTLIVLALWAIVLKFSVIYFVMVVLPAFFEFIYNWGISILQHIQANVAIHSNGTEQVIVNKINTVINSLPKK